MQILVTGAAGFIGSALVRKLLERAPENHVTGIDKFSYAANEASLSELDRESRFRLVRADICDAGEMSAIISAQQPDLVMHLAAGSHVDRSVSGSAVFIQANIGGTHVLLEAVRGYLDAASHEKRETFRFLHVSTDEVFGSLGDSGSFNETVAYDPSSPYSASKAAADHLVRAWGRTYGLPVLITNCSNNFGPRQHPEKLIPITILSALNGRSLPVYGDGRNVRDWLHVEDHAEALIEVALRARSGETYNIGARCERRNIDTVRLICNRLDEVAPGPGSYEERITFVRDRPGHDWRYAIDPSKVEAELGWRARIDFETGLRDTVDWYLANRDWWEPVWASMER